MLINCPKCHSIYEIPDDLIGKTGQNFRCHVCANIWHVMREDALGYKNNDLEEEPLYIEAIPVKEPPHRPYPADKETYTVPADSKSGRHTKSSKDIVLEEGDADYTPKIREKKEITLTSEHGTSFTINADTVYNEQELKKDKRSPHLLDEDDLSFHADRENRLLPEEPFKGYPKTKAFLVILMLIALVLFLRREVVAFYPDAEPLYNKIHLTGLDNANQLKFENINIAENKIDDNTMITITADIVNPSHYRTYVPDITLSGQNESYPPKQNFLTAGEKTTVEITQPIEKISFPNLTLGFKQP